MIYCLINIYYRFIGPTETQLEVRENTADLEVKLEKKNQSNFICNVQKHRNI